MIIEARLRDDIFINIDAEATSGMSRGMEHNYPDQALDNMITLAQQVTSRLSELATGESAPDALEVRFGIKVDGNSAVTLCRSPDTAQLQITARWSKD